MKDNDIAKQAYDTAPGSMRRARESERLVAYPAGEMLGAAGQRSTSPVHDQLVTINLELDSLEKGFAHLEERLRIVLTPPSPENAAKDAEGQYPATPLQESLLAITSRLMYLRRVLNHISSRIDL